MNQNRLQLLAAFVLGALLPSLLFRLVMPQRAAQSVPDETLPTTQQTEPAIRQVLIPVLSEEGLRMMDLEEYVVCVVLAEMYASFEEAALQAQAVAARTYAMKRCEEGSRHEQGAVCTDSGCCQAYISREDYLLGRGTQEDVDKVAQCVQDTRGWVLYWQGEFAECTYFSCSGGRTEDAVAVWGSEIPYLQSVNSPGEEQSGSYSRSVYMSRTQLQEKLGCTLSGQPGDWLGMVTYTEGGGVSTMVFAGRSYSGVTLRKLLGLSSTAFTMVAEEDGITIQTKGKGHRVGMSQYGAHAMAGQGHTWQEILQHYYPGTEIDKLDAVE